MYYKQKTLSGRIFFYQDSEDRSRPLMSPGSDGAKEKDLSEREYIDLQKILNICREQDTACPVTAFRKQPWSWDVTVSIFLPVLMKMERRQRQRFRVLGASCHSVEEAKMAEKLGCTYLTAGHIFETECKKGLPRRGLDFLNRVCSDVSVPVYAIGGFLGQYQ